MTLLARAKSIGLASTSLFQRLAFAAAAAVYTLIVFGSVLRITGTALACGSSWPLCNGNLLPGGSLPTLLAYSYRALSLLTAALILATAAAGWRDRHSFPAATRAAGAALGLLALHIGLAATVVASGLHPIAVVAHLGVSLALLAALIMAGALVGNTAEAGPLKVAQRRFRQTMLLSAGALFGLALLGGYTAATSTAFACGPQLLCGGIQGVHRGAAITVGLLLAALIWNTARTRFSTRSVRFAALTLGISFVGQSLVGAGSLLINWPPLAASLHQTFAAAAWVGMVALILAAWNVPAQPRAVRTEALPRWRQVLDDYYKLTKPGVISLLLLTTLTTMYVAGQPSLALVFWTMLGGYLMAGGANAINCYLDRDVDVLMGRTARRPIPSNRINATHALIFGLALGTLSFAIFGLFVNLLSAGLSLFALLFYIFIYTKWLKRTSTQNIVIGGAAGAIPPMIGWTAVTGQISLLPILMFVIIFYWTPPHFWALALIRRDDYARAGIPMLPVVMGEQETKRQILLYTIIMIVTTLLPFFFQLLGPIYLVSALALNAIFLADTLRLMRATGTTGAWKLYKYSLLYLALLFAAMVLDAQVLRLFA